MEDPMVILANLNAIQERYNRLQNLFNEFCAQILNTKKENEGLNIIGVEQSGNILSIAYLDRNIEAKFSSFVDDDGGQNGYIYCLLLSQTVFEKPKLIETFSFNGQGITSLATNNANDPYVINDLSDAMAIALNWAAISAKENLHAA